MQLGVLSHRNYQGPKPSLRDMPSLDSGLGWTNFGLEQRGSSGPTMEIRPRESFKDGIQCHLFSSGTGYLPKVPPIEGPVEEEVLMEPEVQLKRKRKQTVSKTSEPRSPEAKRQKPPVPPMSKSIAEQKVGEHLKFLWRRFPNHWENLLLNLLQQNSLPFPKNRDMIKEKVR